MGGVIPGALGVAAFGAIKFGGYSAAAWRLKKIEPVIAAGAAKIAAVRTGLGFVLGPPATFLGMFLAERVFSPSSNLPYAANSHVQNAAIYGVLFLARIFVWALVLFLFTRRTPLPSSRFWLYAFLGAVVSSLLDWPGYALAIAAPGKISIC
ncbi:MAG: hypothetical protein LAN71_09680 [Acidobacteriia bacterium]|nr:hypothetical protein [Terriglobia bacterium]